MRKVRPFKNSSPKSSRLQAILLNLVFYLGPVYLVYDMCQNGRTTCYPRVCPMFHIVLSIASLYSLRRQGDLSPPLVVRDQVQLYTSKQDNLRACVEY